MSESFNVEVGVRQGCVMSPWLFNTYMDGYIGEMKVEVWYLGARRIVRGMEQPLVVGLYVDDTVLLAESEGLLQKIVDEFDWVCKRRKLKVNAGKSKVRVFREQESRLLNLQRYIEWGQRLYLDVRYSWGKRWRRWMNSST